MIIVLGTVDICNDFSLCLVYFDDFILCFIYILRSCTATLVWKLPYADVTISTYTYF